MGALGNLTRKIAKQNRIGGRNDPYNSARAFLDGISPQQRALCTVDGDTITMPLEMSRREVEERETVGEIQARHPSMYHSHDVEFKGSVFNGECNRAACDSRGATFYNTMTFAYYCVPCGRSINASTRVRGKPICVEVTANLTHEQMDERYKAHFA